MQSIFIGLLVYSVLINRYFCKNTDYSIDKTEIIKFLDRSLQHSVEVRSYVGRQVRFDCRASGVPTPTIRWEKDGKNFSSVSYRLMHTHQEFNPWVLVLDNLLVADIGKYKCIVSNSLATRSNSFELIVEEKPAYEEPEIDSLSPLNVTLYEGSNVSFYCGSKPLQDVIPFIRWEKHVFRNVTTKKNDSSTSTINVTESTWMTTSPRKIEAESTQHQTVLQRMENISVAYQNGIREDIINLKLEHSESSVLELTDISLNDTAVYVCVVFNNVGYTKKNATLNVLPIPEPTISELERLYILKYSKGEVTLNMPLSFIIIFPSLITIVCIMGYIYWREHCRDDMDDEISKKKESKIGNVVTSVIGNKNNDENNNDKRERKSKQFKDYITTTSEEDIPQRMHRSSSNKSRSRSRPDARTNALVLEGPSDTNKKTETYLTTKGKRKRATTVGEVVGDEIARERMRERGRGKVKVAGRLNSSVQSNLPEFAQDCSENNYGSIDEVYDDDNDCIFENDEAVGDGIDVVVNLSLNANQSKDAHQENEETISNEEALFVAYNEKSDDCNNMLPLPLQLSQVLVPEISITVDDSTLKF